MLEDSFKILITICESTWRHNLEELHFNPKYRTNNQTLYYPTNAQYTISRYNWNYKIFKSVPPCLNKGRPPWYHLFYYVNLLLNMFRMLIHPSSGACDYLVCYCVDCIVLTWGVLVLNAGWTTTSGSACTRIPHHQQPIPLHNTSTPQASAIQPTQ